MGSNATYESMFSSPSCDPLRIFIYNDGLVRLGTEKYVDPTEPNGRQQLLTIRRRLALEFFEYHNCGNWCLIFPTDDRTAQKRFASFMLANFAQFHKGKSTDLLKELEETYLYPVTESMYMHLTNYAVNKRHAGYVSSPDEMHGSKRSFSFLDQYLRNTRQVDPHTVWRSIRDLIVKTMAIAAPHLLHSYRMCRRGQPRIVRTFSLDAMASRTLPRSNVSRSQVRNETNITDRVADFGHQHGNRGLSVPFCQSSFFEILGFDILLDADLKPWLIEVNRSPSFNGDQELDRRVKHGLLKDALRLLNIRPTDKENIEKEQKLHSFRRLYKNNAPIGHFRQKEPTRDVSTDRCLKTAVGKSQKTQANVPSYCWEQMNPVIEKEISTLGKEQAAMEVLVDCSYIKPIRLSLLPKSKVSEFQTIPKRVCSIPLLHYRPTKQPAQDSGIQFQEAYSKRLFAERSLLNNLTLTTYNLCLQNLVKWMRQIKLFDHKTKTDSRTTNKSVVRFLSSQRGREVSEAVIFEITENVQNLIAAHFCSLCSTNTARNWQTETTLSDDWRNWSHIFKGLRIVRLLHRIRNRLLTNRARLFSSIVEKLE
ncbi:hypothetical protein AHF37_01103 [Paragonimus kellicotti]|nr:hypothetical protein AHF37_01103 [Paragonimus kellicotti]